MAAQGFVAVQLVEDVHLADGGVRAEVPVGVVEASGCGGVFANGADVRDGDGMARTISQLAHRASVVEPGTRRPRLGWAGEKSVPPIGEKTPNQLSSTRKAMLAAEAPDLARIVKLESAWHPEQSIL
ncbi:hypothetical protein MMC11_004923 [Xylographa trunciseda]|nr:hypothetical protein [Xylographa trunciseda]